MRSRKPWLNYHKPGAPVPEYDGSPKKPRELFWARFWLVLYSFFGIHRFYLGQTKAGLVWLVVGLPYSIILAFILEETSGFTKGNWTWIIPFLIWILIIIIEYRRLPKLVRKANEKIFGRRVLHDVRLQGGIGPYASMRPIILALAGSYFCAFIIELNRPNFVAGPIVLCLIFFIAVIQYAKIRKIRDEEFRNDPP